MNDYIKQKPPEKLKYVDEDLLVDRTGRKAFRAAAYSMGIAIGFIILSPFLPDLGDTNEQSDQIIGVFRMVAFWMIGYSITVAFSFFFMRPRIKAVLFILNWIVMPAVVLNAILSIKDIMSGGAL